MQSWAGPGSKADTTHYVIVLCCIMLWYLSPEVQYFLLSLQCVKSCPWLQVMSTLQGLLQVDLSSSAETALLDNAWRGAEV